MNEYELEELKTLNGKMPRTPSEESRYDELLTKIAEEIMVGFGDDEE